MIFKLMCLCLIVATDAIDPIGDFSEIIDETCLKWPLATNSSDTNPRLNAEIASKNYDMGMPANPRKTYVMLNLRVQNVFTLDDENEVVSFNALMKTKWIDERLSIVDKTNCWRNNSEIATVCAPGLPPLHTKHGETIKELIWSPSLAISSMVDKVQGIIELDKSGPTNTFYLCTGEVHTFEMSAIKMSCNLDFTWYPWDTQVCPLIIFPTPFLSTGRAGMKLYWDIDSPSEDELIFPGKFDAESNWRQWMTVVRDANYNSTMDSYLKINFWFERNALSHLAQMFIPSVMITIVSISSLYVPTDQVPGRVALAITTMLSIVAMSNNVFEVAPRTGYLKAVDVWMLGCFTITFTALIEFVVVLHIQKHYEKDQGQRARCAKKGRMWIRTSERIDSLFRILLPLIFVLAFMSFIAAVYERGYDNALKTNGATEGLEEEEVMKRII